MNEKEEWFGKSDEVFFGSGEYFHPLLVLMATGIRLQDCRKNP
jgi:hypothetical protein